MIEERFRANILNRSSQGTSGTTSTFPLKCEIRNINVDVLPIYSSPNTAKR